MTIKNEEKVRNWENIILRWKQTSLSMTQFCKLENLSIDTFKYWKYKLAGSRNSEAVDMRNAIEGLSAKVKGLMHQVRYPVSCSYSATEITG